MESPTTPIKVLDVPPARVGDGEGVRPEMNAIPPSNPAEPTSSLRPKEHGAYAILLIPMLLALFVAGPTLAGACVMIAATAGFLAHEPLLVALGKRGLRSQRSNPKATSQLAFRLLLALVGGLAALAFSPPAGRIALVGCLAVASVGFALAIAGKHRTLMGQLWGVIGLSAPCVPILLAGDVSISNAARVWAVLLIGFFSTTLAVRGVIASQKRQPKTIHWSLFAIIVAILMTLLARNDYWILASLPMVGISAYLLLFPPPAKHLKRVGWSLVSGTMLSAILTASVMSGV